MQAYLKQFPFTLLQQLARKPKEKGEENKLKFYIQI